MKGRMKNSVELFVFLAAMSISSSWSQTASWTYPGCSAVTANDASFTYTTLVRNSSAPDPTLSEPDKLAFDMDDSGNVDVYWTEIRPGNIKRYNAKTKTVKRIVKLPNWNGPYYTVTNSGNAEEGVTGIVFDPHFKTNHYVYVHWSPLADTTFRISRFTITSNSPSGNTLDTILMSSEKILLSIPAQRNECCHTGGEMVFDDYGDLWIAQGPNGGRGTNTNPTGGINEINKYQSEEWGASNTHGMRGGILRIHPDPTDPRGYTIPSGNFGEYFAQQTGNSQYLDTSKVLPEIYIKGTRNCYSLSVDPVRRWVMWGDVGPDVNISYGGSSNATNREEDNLRKTPGYEGWPYFVGKNSVYSFSGTAKIPGAPTNTSKWNTGMTTLPPARPATKLHSFGTASIAGPLYRYDGNLQSSVKMPPHFNRKWFVTDWSSGTTKIHLYTLDSLHDDTVLTDQTIFTNLNIYGPVDFRAGPDGALYLVNYGTTTFATQTNTSIVKISYTGTCRPTDLKLELPTGVTPFLNPGARYVSNPKGWWVNLRSGATVVVPEGMIRFELYNLTGRKVWEIKSLRTGDSFKLPVLERGAFQYRWVSNK